ncbi:MAG: histidine kinase dimerization/phospho-acceptor domain-containing protein [Candidatus Thorarchaeota archaeon]
MSKIIDQEELSEFMHSLSHDIKNILHNIQGYVNLLEQEDDPEYLAGVVRLIQKAKQTLEDYVSLADNGNLTKRPSQQK